MRRKLERSANASPRALRCAAWICSGVSALLVAVTALAAVIETRQVLAGRDADATVVKYVARSDRRDPPRALIQFDTESGTTVEARYPSSLKFDQPSIGEHLAVVYDPSNPECVVAREFSFRARTYATLLGFAAFWMIPALLSFRRLRQRRTATHGTDVRAS